MPLKKRRPDEMAGFIVPTSEVDTSPIRPPAKSSRRSPSRPRSGSRSTDQKAERSKHQHASADSMSEEPAIARRAAGQKVYVSARLREPPVVVEQPEQTHTLASRGKLNPVDPDLKARLVAGKGLKQRIAASSEAETSSDDDSAGNFALTSADYDLIQAQEEAPRGARQTKTAARPKIERSVRSDMGEITEFEFDDVEVVVDFDPTLYEPITSQIETSLGEELPDEAYDIPDCEDAGQFPNVTDRKKLVSLVSKVEQDGWNLVIDHALKAEKASGSKTGQLYGGEERSNFFEWSYMTLCSMHHRVVPELVHGNLALAARYDKLLANELRKYYERARDARHPCIYARVLVAQDGSSMTIAHAQRVIKWLRRYISESDAVKSNNQAREVFYRIDAHFFPRWQFEYTNEGRRRSLETKEHARSESRVEVVRKFCNALEARCQGHEDVEVLSPPLLYVGYAERADIRARQHEACGSSSNWLASLVQAICNLLWEDAYKMHFFVICLLGEEGQGSVAEMILTILPGAYYFTGGGFCIDIAGKSMESLYFNKLTRAEAAIRWNECFKWVDEHTPVAENWELHVARDAARKERVRAENARIAAIGGFLERVQDDYALTQLKKDTPTFQTEEGREVVEEAKRLWEEMREQFPEYVAD